MSAFFAVCLCVYCRVSVLWGEQKIPITINDVLGSSLDKSSMHLLLLLCLQIDLYPHIEGNTAHKWQGLAQVIHLVFGLLCYFITHALLL